VETKEETLPARDQGRRGAIAESIPIDGQSSAEQGAIACPRSNQGRVADDIASTACLDASRDHLASRRSRPYLMQVAVFLEEVTGPCLSMIREEPMPGKGDSDSARHYD